MNAFSFKTAGIDGCRGGWVVALLLDGKIDFQLIEKLSDVSMSDVERVFLDIPIGLPEHGLRPCDGALRALLPAHLKSSVFMCPVREAVYASDYTEARRVSIEKTGRSMSIQAWNICPKIRETDGWISDNADLQSIVYESHPEWNWLRLNALPLPSKHTTEGLNVRKRILEERNIVVPERLSSKTVHAKHDDLLDAAVLAVSAALSIENGLLEASGNLPDVWTFA